MSEKVFTVEGIVLAVVDGDTIKAEIDLGWKIYHKVHIRLTRCDAPELPTAQGKRACEALKARLKIGDKITIESRELDKYGRTLGHVTHNGVELSAWLIRNGFAVLHL